MDAVSSRLLARWVFKMDPSARRVLFVHPPEGFPSAHAPDLAFKPNLLVVLRETAEPERVVERDRFVMPHTLWELNPIAFQAVEQGTLAKPRGFEMGRWEEVPPPDAPGPFRVARVTLRNIRCFENKTLAFEPGFNILIGGNSSGKTTVLDALAEVFQRPIRALCGQEEAAFFSMEDVRRAEVRGGEVPVEEPQYPADVDTSLSMFGDDLDKEYGWSVTAEHGGVWMGTGRPVSFVNVLDFARLSVQSGYDVALPVYAYYRTGRAWTAGEAGNGASSDERSRLAGYSGWDRPSVDIRPLEQWWNRMELLRAQRGGSLGVLDAVRRAVLQSLGSSEYEDVRYDADLLGLAAKRVGGPWLPFRKLSDGTRNMFGMVADLAMRCARLNPHFGAEATEKTSGVVLVDELDLHLHPRWQRRIVADLRAAFPRVQFIATTHSPSILQSLHGGALISLDGKVPEHPADMSIEDILRVLMDVEDPQKSSRWLDMVKAARTYQQALDGAREATAEEKARLREDLDRLLEPYGDNPAYVAFLQLRRAAAGVDDGPVQR